MAQLLGKGRFELQEESPLQTALTSRAVRAKHRIITFIRCFEGGVMGGDVRVKWRDGSPPRESGGATGGSPCSPSGPSPP
jgi:hypothetical protein